MASRRPKQALCAFAVAGGLLGGCGHSGSRSPATQAAKEPEFSPVTRERLALQRPDGRAAVDVLIANFEHAVEQHPSRGDVWVVLGRTWVRKARETTDPGFYINARAAADMALKLDPIEPSALGLRGLVLLSEHRFEEARALAQGVLDAHPEDSTALGIRSDALLELGRFEEAARSAQQMMDLKPNLPSYSRASYFRWVQGDIEGAKHLARLAIDCGADQRDPEPRAWAMVQAALIFLHEGDYVGAEAGFDRALEQMPDFPPALTGKGRLAMALGEPSRAAQLLRRAYDANPLAETAWLLGDARSLAGDAAGSDEAYALVERTGKRIDRRTLALFWATKNAHAGEALALAQAERSGRGDVYTEDALGWALYRNGKFEEARAAMGRALAQHTRDARLLFHAGAIHMATGDRAGGRQLLESALALEPAFDVSGADEARRLLADAKR
jgi:tetratricopeptide (TPR) repeat protein